MAYQLVEEVIHHAPSKLDPAAKLALVVIAESARIEDDRRCYLSPEDLARGVNVQASSLGKVLARLQRAGLEVRVQIGTVREDAKRRAGAPVFAVTGRAPTYRLPPLVPPSGCTCPPCKARGKVGRGSDLKVGPGSDQRHEVGPGSDAIGPGSDADGPGSDADGPGSDPFRAVDPLSVARATRSADDTTALDAEFRAAATAAAEVLAEHAAFLGATWTVDQAEDDLRRCVDRAPQRFVDDYVAKDNAVGLAAALRAHRPLSSDQHRERLRQNWRTGRVSA